ncbi:hypothetical protein B7P43_G13275, partial [Cryptotermes secundus]
PIYSKSLLKGKFYTLYNELRQYTSSWPRTSWSDNMVERVEKVVLEDRRLSVENIASKVGISVGSVHTILHEDLRMQKVSSRWVPRMLADDHQGCAHGNLPGDVDTR